MKQISMALCGALLLVGCGKWPPVTNTARDVLRLPESTVSIRARALRGEDYESLRHLQQLERLDLYGGWKASDAGFSDRGLETLAALNLPRLNTVLFGNCTNVTDASIIHIRKLKTVYFLVFVSCPGITDNGLRSLAEMESLRNLDLIACPNITDKGLEYLAAHSHWQRIEFAGSPRVTAAAVEALQQKFPTAYIKKDELVGVYPP